MVDKKEDVDLGLVRLDKPLNKQDKKLVYEQILKDEKIKRIEDIPSSKSTKQKVSEAIGDAEAKIKAEYRKDAPSVKKNVGSFFSWLGKEATIVGGKVKQGVQDYSVKRQAQVAEEERLAKLKPKVKAPEVDGWGNPIAKPKPLRTYVPRHRKPRATVSGDTITLTKTDFKKYIQEAVAKGRAGYSPKKHKVHRPRVKVLIPTKKLKPFQWIGKP